MIALGDAFSKSRKRLFGFAYRMLGSASDADDIVQETFLKASEASADQLRSPEAFFMKIAGNLCYDRLRSTREGRAGYVGPWLPEPIPDVEGLTPEGATELADDLSFALLMTLERLSPAERAAFLMHDIFDVPFPEIAIAIGRSEEACLQLASRARRRVGAARPARKVAPAAHEKLMRAFAEALSTRDPERLKAILAADAVAYADDGGDAAAAQLEGAGEIIRHMVDRETKSAAHFESVELMAAAVNGAPGLLLYRRGRLAEVITIATDGRRIQAIYVVRDRQKLRAMSADAAPLLERNAAGSPARRIR